MNSHDLGSRSVWAFFLLVFLLSVPVWLISSLLGNQLPIPVNLPISAVLFTAPVLAASILVFRRNGAVGVKDLLKKAFDLKKIRNHLWTLSALFLVPLIYGMAYAVMRWMDEPLPAPETPLAMLPVFFGAYFIGAACEELGWSGYAIDPLQARWGALRASLILGVVWQVWHIIGDVQAGHAAVWIVWHSLYSVALRILITWIYNNAGKSVFAAILTHTMDNVSWSMFPNYGSGYDPVYTMVIAWAVVLVVIALWGGKTLARYRFAR